MMHFEALVMKLPHALDAKVIDGTLYYHFTIYPDHRIEYEILINHGTLVCIADAKLEDMEQEEDYGHKKRLVIQTKAYVFEVLPVPDYRNSRFLAYKILRKPQKF
jgi:hypothetical protein